MKKIFVLSVCVLLCLTGAAQQYAPWTPDQGPLDFATLTAPYVQTKYSTSYNNPSIIGTNTSGAATSHQIITQNTNDPCRCYRLGGTIYEKYLPPTWDGTPDSYLSSAVMLGCGKDHNICKSASQIEYWFYPQPDSNTLQLTFSFAIQEVDYGSGLTHRSSNQVCTGPGYSSSASLWEPQFWIELYDGETGGLLELGYYPTKETANTSNPQNNTNWPYSRFLSWPSGASNCYDQVEGPNSDGITYYYWAAPTATPTTFDYRKCPKAYIGAGGDNEQDVLWFEYKPLAFNLKKYADMNKNGNVKSVKLRLHTVGCDAHAHWAYALFNARMIPGTINVAACGDEPIHLSVPWGFEEHSYLWRYGNDSTDAATHSPLDLTLSGITALGDYDIYIDRDLMQVWPYYRCEVKSYTGVPFVYEAHIKAYYLKPEFTFKQKFENCALRTQLIDSSLIYIKFPSSTPGGLWDSTFLDFKHIKWFVKNQQTQIFDSIPNHYDSTNFTYTFFQRDPYIPPKYIDTLTGQATVKIVIQDSLKNCIDSIEKVITLDLAAIQDTLTKDTIYTCEEKLPYVFDQANFGEINTWSTDGTRRVIYQKKACNGCDSIVDVTLIVRKPKVDITSDPEYCEAFTTNLTAESTDTIIQYKWDNGETSPVMTVTAPGTYSVEIMNQDSCIASNSIVIPACKPFLNLPNSITPSKIDGVNDYFRIPQSNLIKELEFTVFNRHGVQVYHTTNKDFEWNGTENGKLYVGATYTYILRIVDYEGVASWHKGAITIL